MPSPRRQAKISIPRVNSGEEAFVFWCRAFKLPLPKREYVFHPTRKWRLDFAWPDLRAAVEIEGGIWVPGGGAHSRPMNIRRDLEKGNALAMLGWHVLRIPPEDVARGKSMQLVDAFLAMAAASVQARAAAAARFEPCSPSVAAGHVPPSSPQRIRDFKVDPIYGE